MRNSRSHIKELTCKISRNLDPLACREFYQLFFNKLIGFTLQFVYDIQSAEDIVSEVFYKLFKKPRNIEKIDDITYYLYKAVRNEATTYFHKNKKPIQEKAELAYIYDFIIDRNTPESKLLHQELIDTIEDTINRMPPKRKIIYQLIYLDGLKYKEVAQLLSLSVNTVENHMVAAIREMRISITQYYQDKNKPPVSGKMNNIAQLF